MIAFMLFLLIIEQIEPSVAVSNDRMQTVSKMHESTQFGELQDRLNDSRLQGATTAISIRNAANGEIVYEQLGECGSMTVCHSQPKSQCRRSPLFREVTQRRTAEHRGPG